MVSISPLNFSVESNSFAICRKYLLTRGLFSAIIFISSAIFSIKLRSINWYRFSPFWRANLSSKFLINLNFKSPKLSVSSFNISNFSLPETSSDKSLVSVFFRKFLFFVKISISHKLQHVHSFNMLPSLRSFKLKLSLIFFDLFRDFY